LDLCTSVRSKIGRNIDPDGAALPSPGGPYQELSFATRDVENASLIRQSQECEQLIRFGFAQRIAVNMAFMPDSEVFPEIHDFSRCLTEWALGCVAQAADGR
jgi:hypothetical protein